MGEDANFRTRSLENPNITFPETNGSTGFEQYQWESADTYNGNFWRDTGAAWNNGGVHHNSGVQNFWFFLLANGGTNVNDLDQAYNVQGIGIVNAAKIAFRNLDVYTRSNSVYTDARAGSINAARDLFGECSLQYVSTINAWHAVGVGSAINFCVSNISPTYSSHCIENGYYGTYFSLNVWPQNSTVTWYAPANWDYSISGPTFQLYNIIDPAPGNYQLSALVTSGGQTLWSTAWLDIVTCYSNNCPPGDPFCAIARKSIITGIEGIHNETTLLLYPNPASSKINLDLMLPRREENLLTIVDMMGRTVVRMTVENNSSIEQWGLYHYYYQ